MYTQREGARYSAAADANPDFWEVGTCSENFNFPTSKETEKQFCTTNVYTFLEIQGPAIIWLLWF